MHRVTGWLALLVAAVMVCGVVAAQENTFCTISDDDVVLTWGVAAAMPDGAVGAHLVLAIDAAPFYTTSETQIAFSPTFSVDQSLETGLAWDMGSACVAVDLSLAPWALNWTGGWIEFRPPVWMLAEQPKVSVSGGVGWGPRWTPAGTWTHALGADLDLSAAWSIATVWDSALTVTVDALAAADCTLFSGPLAGGVSLQAGAETLLPLFVRNPNAVRGYVSAVIDLLPGFGLAFDIGLEVCLGAFYAYALVGAGAGGIAAEVGAQVSIGL